MKNSRAFLLLLFVLNLQFSLSQGKDGFVAVPYPGSISEPPQKGLEWRSQTFYSKDPTEKVKAHYTKTLGPFEQYDNITCTREVIPNRELVSFLEKHGVILGEAMEFPGGVFAGVALHGKPNNYNNNVNNVLDKLRSAYLMRFNNGNAETMEDVARHLEDAELKQTLARYEHVKWEYFVMTKDGSMDKILFEKYLTKPGEDIAKEQGELTKKMTELTRQMKYDEAGKVGDRLMELSSRSTDARWNWDNAMKCLQEMEKNAYATKIVIDKHPSQWDLSHK